MLDWMDRPLSLKFLKMAYSEVSESKPEGLNVIAQGIQPCVNVKVGSNLAFLFGFPIVIRRQIASPEKSIFSPTSLR